MSIDLSTIWDGAYGGLYHEVVFEDCYRVKMLDFIPDIVIDLGANVGTFTKMAHELWPQAHIIAVEPDFQNQEYFLANIPDADNIHLIKAAIGSGEIFRCHGAPNGAGESYVSAGLGYTAQQLKDGGDSIKKTNVKTVRLYDLFTILECDKQQILIKIDIEGAESAIFTDPIQMAMLRLVDYIAMELHYHALEAESMDEVKRVTKQALQSLETTHDCEYIHPMFYARKKKT